MRVVSAPQMGMRPKSLAVTLPSQLERSRAPFRGDSPMAQQSLKTYIDNLERSGLLKRYTEEKRVDELPRLMEDNPDHAILVDRVKDCAKKSFCVATM